jgi:protein-L-isoaspartate(D-aspartate) O-methyltransferase
MPDFSQLRARMVDTQVAWRGVRDAAVLQAMRVVPREAFVDGGFKEFAYEDSPLPIGEGQTISQPYLVALMIEAAELGPLDRALEVGAGSGYAAAVMSRIAARVYTVERHAMLADGARRRFEALGYDNIELRAGDGTLGWPEAAPFDAILVAAGAPDVPEALKAQLRIGGRLIVPVGLECDQMLLKIIRASESLFEREELGGVRFVPLIGEQGWAEDARRAATAHVPGGSARRRRPLAELFCYIR